MIKWFAETGRVIIIKAEIVAVISIESYISYKNCSGKVTQTNQGLGECAKLQQQNENI